MLLTVTTTHRPATDLGYLLHKNPARVQTEELSCGKAHVFYPEAGESCCAAAVLLEVDPVALVRGRRGRAGEGGQLEQYVSDRPYGANSFMSVALEGSSPLMQHRQHHAQFFLYAARELLSVVVDVFGEPQPCP